MQKNKLNVYSYICDGVCFEYFIGYEVAVLLGYKNTKDVILKNVSKSNKIHFRDYAGVKEPKLDPRVILVTRDGASEIVSKTKKNISPDVLHILQQFNIEKKEQSILLKNEINENEYKLEEDDFTIEVDIDNELTTYSYINNDVCFEYFIGYEVATLLGYSNTTQVVLNNVSKINQLIFYDYPGVKYPKLDPKTILITRDGVIEMLLKTRKHISPDVLHILKKFNIETLDNTEKKEQTLDDTEDELTTYSYINNDLCFEYFVGYEVAGLLGYSNTSQVIINNVSKSNQLSFYHYPGEKYPNLDPKTILVTRDGVIEMLHKTRKLICPKVLHILKKFNIEKKEILDDTERKEETLDDTEDELTTYSYINNHLCFEYFVGYEVAALLGYSNTTQVILNNVSKSNQLMFYDYPGAKYPQLDPKTILITRDGVIEMLLKTRKRISPDVLYILKKFNIDTTNKKCLTKEQQTLSAITNAFKTEKFEDQYKIGNYYLDLYFPEYKIVVECDENGHADRKPYNERERMDFVNETLGINDANWVRYNPDEYDFDVLKVISRIHNIIKEQVKQLSLSSNQKETKKKEFRKCSKCKITKKLTEEFFNLCGKGLSKDCKECCYIYGTGNEKPVKQYDLDGNFIRRYNSSKEAAELNKFNAVNIARCCRGEIKTSYDYIWIFINSDEDNQNNTNALEESTTDVLEENTTNEKIDINKRKNSVIKTVAQYDIDGTFIKTYISAREAVRAMKVSPRSIYSAIENKFICKGFQWRYVIDGNIIEKIEEATPHKKFMKQVEIYKDGKLYKSFISIIEACKGMKISRTLCRKYLSGIKKDPIYEWKLKTD
jgi:prophage antirepressor-like protein/very-short-patch-repair endonuclease